MPLLINGEEKSIINWICFIWPRFISYIFRRKCRVRNSYSILLGIAGALIMPTTLSMIRVIFENPKERATALAVWSIASSIGAVFGPIIGGALLEQFSWHSAF